MGAAYLGADAPIGNRDRLKRELDRLKRIGVNNVRILGSSELSPLKNSVRPTFRDRTSNYNETLLRGLDVALAEMGRRDMTAVIYLTNFWEWSGGMMTYLYWTNGGHYINMNDPAHPWPEFADSRRNSTQSRQPSRCTTIMSGPSSAAATASPAQLYRDDPAIMAWQLANEPRPAEVPKTAVSTCRPISHGSTRQRALIKSLDPNHLVSTGSEGTQGCIEDDACVVNAHSRRPSTT